MTLLSRLATKPHLIAQTEGVTIVEALYAVPVAERDDDIPVRFVRISKREQLRAGMGGRP